MASPITDINQLDMDGTYTVADYLSWQFDELVQVVKGKVFRMSPAPRDMHAVASEALERQLFKQIPFRSPCKVKHAPYDVYLSETEGRKPTILQPDILIVCNARRIEERGCIGPPDWVCEIVSKGSYKMDTIIKKQAYEEAGVPEYTLVFPGEQVVQVHTLGPDGRYGEPAIYNGQGQAWALASVPGVRLEYALIFPPEEEEAGIYRTL